MLSFDGLFTCSWFDFVQSIPDVQRSISELVNRRVFVSEFSVIFQMCRIDVAELGVGIGEIDYLGQRRDTDATDQCERTDGGRGWSEDSAESY